MTNKIIDQFLTTREAAKLLGVAHRTMRLYTLRHSGLSVKIANRRLVDRDALGKLIARGTLIRRGGGHG